MVANGSEPLTCISSSPVAVYPLGEICCTTAACGVNCSICNNKDLTVTSCLCCCIKFAETTHIYGSLNIINCVSTTTAGTDPDIVFTTNNCTYISCLNIYGDMGVAISIPSGITNSRLRNLNIFTCCLNPNFNIHLRGTCSFITEVKSKYGLCCCMSFRSLYNISPCCSDNVIANNILNN